MSNPGHTIGSDTIARTIVLALALLNQILAIAGHETIAFTDNDIYQLVSLCWTIGASLVAWWKNNSFRNLFKYWKSKGKWCKDSVNKTILFC